MVESALSLVRGATILTCGLPTDAAANAGRETRFGRTHEQLQSLTGSLISSRN
jgi:hypothetical protein